MADTLWYQQEPAGGLWLQASEPRHATPIGDAEREPLGVFLGNAAMDAIERAMSNDPDAPLIGLLIGRPLHGPRRPFILVTGVIPLAGAVTEDGRPRFTARVFEEAFKIWSANHGDSAVVGWFSARPRNGADITSYESYAHHRFFPEMWQLAFLIDSTYRTSRLYRWEGQQLTPCDSFYFWNASTEPVTELMGPDVATMAAHQLAAAHESQLERSQSGVLSKPWIWVAAGLVLVYLLIPQAPGSLFWLRAQQADHAANLRALEQSLAQLELETSQLMDLRERTEIQAPEFPTGEAAAESAAAATEPETEGEVRDQPEQQSSGDVTDVTRALPTVSGNDEQSLEVDSGSSYVIQPGDTMWSISTELLGDPWAFRSLAEQNEIQDPNRIFAGQTLRLPLETSAEDASEDEEPPSVNATPGP